MRTVKRISQMSLLVALLAFAAGCGAMQTSWDWTKDATVWTWDASVGWMRSDMDPSGPLYAVNPIERSFRCIGETGPIEVRWNDETQMRFSDMKTDLTEVTSEGRDAIFQLNENWEEGLTKGVFRVKTGQIFSSRGKLKHKVPTADDPSVIIGILTGSPNEKPKLNIAGGLVVYEIEAGGPGAQYEFISPMTEKDIVPFKTWVVSVLGKQKKDGENRVIIADKIVLAHQDNPDEKDDPNLKRVLIIGDSLSIVLWPTIESALGGKVNLHRPFEAGTRANCGSSANGARNIRRWLGPYWLPGHKWDVIQFNHGLHDLRQEYNEKKLVWTGNYEESFSDYKENIKAIAEELEKTGASILWATTTPVPADSWRDGSGRQAGTAQLFNIEAKEALSEYPQILVNDLWQQCQGRYVVNPTPSELNANLWFTGQDVHPNSTGRKALGLAVSRFILQTLGIPEDISK